MVYHVSRRHRIRAWKGPSGCAQRWQEPRSRAVPVVHRLLLSFGHQLAVNRRAADGLGEEGRDGVRLPIASGGQPPARAERVDRVIGGVEYEPPPEAVEQAGAGEQILHVRQKVPSASSTPRSSSSSWSSIRVSAAVRSTSEMTDASSTNQLTSHTGVA